LKTVHIDFVSDIACPWCAIGLASLEKALSVVGDEVNVEIHFQPFELNAHMPLGGQDVIEYLTEKVKLKPTKKIFANVPPRWAFYSIRKGASAYITPFMRTASYIGL
jgi:predicted DsbA family dithiol-disulfide isomerase